MVLLKDNGQGIYITDDLAAKIVSNTPGDLTLGTLGTDYIYLDEIVLFKRSLNLGNQSDNMPGHQINKIGAGKTGHNTGEGDLGGFIINATGNETLAENTEKFSKRQNRTGAEAIYLIRQTASDVFRNFSNDAFALKKYCPVIIFTMESTEVHEKGFDNLLINIMCGEVWP